MEKNETENKKPGVMIYFEILPQLGMLKPSQRLAIYDAIMAYGKDRTEPELKREAALAWGFIKPILDRDDLRYHSVVDARKKGGKVRGEQLKKEASKRKVASAQTASAYLEVSSDSQSTISNLQSSIINPQSSVVNLHLPISTEGEEKKIGPSRDEVRDYVRENGLAVDPEDFWEYYSVRGWALSGEPIRDWKILAHRWDRKENQDKRKETEYKGVDLREFGICR